MGIYVFTMIKGIDFSRSQILHFVTYYNMNKITSYFNRLLDIGLIIDYGEVKGRIRYKVTDLGMQAIREYNELLDKSVISFCSQYGISL